MREPGYFFKIEKLGVSFFCVESLFLPTLVESVHWTTATSHKFQPCAQFLRRITAHIATFQDNHLRQRKPEISDTR